MPSKPKPLSSKDLDNLHAIATALGPAFVEQLVDEVLLHASMGDEGHGKRAKAGNAYALLELSLNYAALRRAREALGDTP